MDPGSIGDLRRAMADLYESVDDVREATGVQIAELDINGVPAILVSPPSPASARGAILHIHGGGLVAGSSRSALERNVRTAMELDCVMLIPDYRLAPEHPYPAALDDTTAAWMWLCGSAPDLGVDATRLVIMGGSAGGCLSAALALRIRNSRLSTARALILIQPQLDDRNTHPSTFEVEDEWFWDRTANLTSWAAYLAGLPDVPTEAAPGRETDLAGLPSTYLEIAQVDLFRDEGLDFAARLSRCGVPVEAHLWAGAFHGFDGLVGTRVAQRAIEARMDFLRSVLR